MTSRKAFKAISLRWEKRGSKVCGEWAERGVWVMQKQGGQMFWVSDCVCMCVCAEYILQITY